MSQPIQCPRCGQQTEIDPEYPQCDYCGLWFSFPQQPQQTTQQHNAMVLARGQNANLTARQSSVRYCQNCGSLLGQNAQCPRCGFRGASVSSRNIKAGLIVGGAIGFIVLVVLIVLLTVTLVVPLVGGTEIRSATQGESSLSSMQDSQDYYADTSVSSDADSSGSDSSSSAAGSMSTKQNQAIAVGQQVAAENWEFVVSEVGWKDEVYSLSDNSFAHYISDEPGKTYYFMELDFKNLDGSAYDFNDFIHVELKFNDKYNIPATFYDPYSSIFSHYFDCDSMTLTKGYMVASVSDDIKNSFASCKITVTMKAPHTVYEINM